MTGTMTMICTENTEIHNTCSDFTSVNHRLDILLQVGCKLMESSADTSRIYRNMKRTAAFLNFKEESLQIYVNYNMLMVNYSDGEKSHTKFKRCTKHIIDMAAISKISKLSWNAIINDFTIEQFEAEFNKICEAPRVYTPWQVALGGGFACGGFCIQFGCDWPAFLYASIAAILGLRLRMYLTTKNANPYFSITIAAFISTVIAWIFGAANIAFGSALPSILQTATPWHPLMACALFIVPGVPLINFISDMLTGHQQVGLTRAINTLIMVLAMALGISFAIEVVGVDNFVRNLSMTPHHEYWEFSIAAAISAMGFSMIFNTPRRLLWVVALGGIIAVCTRNFVNLGPSNGNAGLDLGPIIGSLAGSALVSIICVKAMHWLHTPHHCLSIPSVIPMIPGVLMYRALFAFIEMHGVVGEVTTAMYNGIRASFIILCIAIGVAIPNIFVRRLITPQREKRLMLLVRKRENNLQCDVDKKG